MLLKPRNQNNPKRLTEVKAMTIAAGAVCTDGILICSDTEHTQGDTAKFQKSKTFSEDKDTLIVTGCGIDDSFIKIGYDRLADKIRNGLPADRQAAREFVERSTSKLYKNAQLLVAIRCGNGEPVLIKTAVLDDGASLEEHYSAIGSGRHIFEYWAQYLMFSKPLTLDMASLMMMFMLRETKGIGVGCGGSTNVYKMPLQAGTLKKTVTVYDDREFLAGFPQAPVQVLLDAMDLTRPDKEYEKKIEIFKAQVVAFRAALRNREMVKRGVYTRTASTIMTTRNDETIDGE